MPDYFWMLFEKVLNQELVMVGSPMLRPRVCRGVQLGGWTPKDRLGDGETVIWG